LSDEALCLAALLVVLCFNAWVAVFLWATGLLDSKKTIGRAKAAWKIYREAATWDQRVVAIAIGAVVLATSGAKTIYALAVLVSGWAVVNLCHSHPES
jgi:hypothetical protein